MPVLTALRRFIVAHPTVFLNGKFLVACSGGPDSVALVRALAEAGHAFHIGHVNHRLRGHASDGDARFVRALAHEVDMPFHEKKCPIQKGSGNLEEKARVKRYAALFRMARASGCTWVLTAHTQDDQVETVLMNLFRGSGASGLGGMAPMGLIGRPFLGVSKKEVLAYLKQRRFAFRIDKSNANQDFTRNWLRNTLVPIIEKRFPGIQLRIARMADILREEEAAWERIIAEMADELLSGSRGGRLLDFKGLIRYSPAEQRRFLRRSVGGYLLNFDGVERLRSWMSAPPTSGRLWQGKRGWTVERLSKSKGAPSSKHFLIKQKGK